MSEWLVEQGIGEERAVLLDNGTAIASAMRWPGGLEAGLVDDAVLVSRARGSSRGTARFPCGEEALVDRLPREASEGTSLRLIVTRPATGEAGRTKLARAKPTEDAPRPAPGLAEQLGGREVRRIEGSAWEDIMAEGWDGVRSFPGGALLASPTPAMTLVDVDGTLPSRDLAIAAARAVGPLLRTLDIGGSIGIDFPTLEAKADRKAVDAALAEALADYDHERTAMNGFGFVQIVARMVRPSILHRLRLQPMEAAARLLLRRAEDVQDPGAILLTAHPGVLQCLRAEWLEELARRTGREVRTSADPGLAPRGSFAQAVQR